MSCFRQTTSLMLFFLISISAEKSLCNTQKINKGTENFSEKELLKQLAKSPNDLSIHLKLGIVYYKKIV